MRQTAQRLILILASGAGVGYSRYFPGTLGTLIAVPVSLTVNRLTAADPALGLLALTGLTLLALISADRAARILATKDPQIVVIDEIAGFTLAHWLTHSLSGLITAFVLFRIFDIAKVFPASRLEALPGGTGIVADDMMAGLYTFLILRGLAFLGLV